MNTHRNDVLIAGEWIAVADVFGVENPATGAIIGSGAAARSEHVDAAATAARAAFGEWSTLTASQRADHLDALVAVLRTRRDDLVDATVAEVGAPIEIARPWHVDVSIDILVSAAAHARSFDFAQQHGQVTLLRRAAGVAGFITPWNYPLYQLAAKVGSALAAGCTVVHKPSELTPLSAYIFAEATVEAGLPAGVFNLVPGDGPNVGAPLAAHPQIDVMSFTGSTGVGRKVAAAAVDHLARVCLELGGKSASIVCDDADFKNAVRWTVDACMLNTGQTCSAWTRLLVPAHRLDEAIAIAAQRADEMVVGDPLDPATELGPLISRTQHDRVQAMVDGALERGAKIANSRSAALPETGHYMAPVVLAGLDAADPASRDEIFGPVLVVHGFDDEDEAIMIANNTHYGLAGAVWSADTERAAALAARMDTGQVFINEAEFSIESPFGGWKHSGLGREFGLEGLLEFTELTAVHH